MSIFEGERMETFEITLGEYIEYPDWTQEEKDSYRKKEKKVNVFEDLKKYQTDRGLDKQEFCITVASKNIIEELLEAHGITEDRDRLITRDIYEYMAVLVSRVKCEESGYPLHKVKWTKPTNRIRVDAFCDIQVFGGGEVGKLNYNNEIALHEVAKEISSREGEMLEGKFVKWKDPGSRARWYKADFSKAYEPVVTESKMDVKDGYVTISLKIDNELYSHSIKMQGEIDEDEAVKLMYQWKDLMIWNAGDEHGRK